MKNVLKVKDHGGGSVLSVDSDFLMKSCRSHQPGLHRNPQRAIIRLYQQEVFTFFSCSVN